MNNILTMLRSEKITTVNSERAKPSRKTRRFTAVCAGMVTLIASLSANAAFVIAAGGSTQSLPIPIAGNDFNTDLQGLGFSKMTTGAQLKVDQDGFVDFYYIAAESGFTNTFHNTNGFITEGDDPFNFNGYAMITVEVSANDTLDFSFTSAAAKALTPVNNRANINLEGLGIITAGNGESSLMQLVLAYNDGSIDADFDDMLIRAEFRSVGIPEIPEIPGVPLPAAVWLFGSGLIGLIGMARRRKQ